MNTLTRALSASLVALILAGCASASLIGSSNEQVTAEQRYAAARLDLNDALGSALIYARKPRCTEAIVVGCSKQSVVDRLYEAASAADASLDAAKIALDDTDTGKAAAALRAATALLSSIQAILLAELTEGSQT